MRSKKSTKSGKRSLLIGLSVSLPALLLIIFLADKSKIEKLPLLGEPVYRKVHTKAGLKIDTIFPVVPHFAYTDQDSTLVSNETFKNKIYVADFFFLSCPTICPKMTASIKRVYDTYHNQPNLKFVSYTIDPLHDTPALLKKHAQQLGVSASKWHFLNGKKEEIYNLAEQGFYSPAHPDQENTGSFIHSGGLMLVDGNGHLRGVYDGTSEEETDKLIKDLTTLLNEKMGNF